MITKTVNTRLIDTAPYKVFTKTYILNDHMNVDSPYALPREEELFFTHDTPDKTLAYHLPESLHGIKGNKVRKNKMFPINTFTRYYRSSCGLVWAKQVIIVDLLLFPKARNTY